MVKLKNKYFLVEICYTNNYDKVGEFDIVKAIRDQTQQLYGDVGLGTLNSSFHVKVCAGRKNIFVLKSGVESADYVRTAIPFITLVGKSECVVQLILEASSIRTIEKAVIKTTLNQLYAELAVTVNIKDKERIQQAIMDVTGENVERVRY
uniref:Ribonuclease P/MRP protein subunit POP5 n=1 Tax=Rhabditophanes sp. KR3021 TaxID=114890 RepID=A0AC35TFN3_9BILA